MSVADELRALRDKAKKFPTKPSLQDTPYGPLVYQPEHRYTSSTPPPLSTDDQSHRASPSEQFLYHRDTSSPRSQSNTNLHLCPSPDVDEAFSSLESSMSRFYIQDVPYSMERPLHSYSSGVASYSQSHNDYSLSGSYGGNNQRSCQGGGGYYPQQNGSVSCECLVCSHCRCGHQQTRMPPHHHAGWGSCPALSPNNREHPGLFSEKQYFKQPSNRQSHSLPRDPWVQGSLSDGRVIGRAKTPSSEQRKGLRSQLSTLFPQSTVEQVMNAYPHVSDMSELISLIQSYRTSHISF